MAIHPAQLQPYALGGAGAALGATSILLRSFTTIDGVVLTMADFGAIGYGTLEPGNGTMEEQISFSGVVQNANGTATLTGVKNVAFLSPYTETAGLSKTHAGSTTFVISNTSAYYNQIPFKQNDEIVTGQWTFNSFPITPSNSDASTTVKGVTKLSVAPVGATNPIAVGTNDPRLNPYAASSAGTDTYAITLATADAPGAYTAGQVFTFKADVGNTGTATLNVNSLGAKTIKKNVSNDLETGDILANQISQVEYDGTNFQLISPYAYGSVPVIRTYTSTDTWTKPAGLKYVIVEVQAMGGVGSGTAAGVAGGGGGGAGGYSRKKIAVATLGPTETVTIGTAAAASSFGTHASATAGATASGADGAAGGTGSSGDLNISGQGGGAGMPTNALSQGPFSGGGGSSYFGGGGNGVTRSTGSGGATNGVAGGNYGGGGGGSVSVGANVGTGGAGGPAIVVVTEYYNY